MFEITRYQPEHESQWNEFVANSKNGTFLLDRRFMDYHSDRFRDCSLMVWQKGRLAGLFPANINDKASTVFSHEGLTYGGFISDTKLTTYNALNIFSMINEFLRQHTTAKKVVYKPIPWIYHQLPSEEDLYAITEECKAKLTAREISSTIDLRNKLKFSTLRRRCLAKAIKAGLTVRESVDIEIFWDILSSNLHNKYGLKPVHTIDEIKLLISRFPHRIRLYMAYLGDTALGGTLLFDMQKVVHTQYIAASEEGKRLGALDMVFDYVINQASSHNQYLDFGKSTENEGTYLNESLIFQKEGFGGRGVCYDTYEWDLQ